MAQDKKLSELELVDDISGDDYLYVVKENGGAPQSRRTTVGTLAQRIAMETQSDGIDIPYILKIPDWGRTISLTTNQNDPITMVMPFDGIVAMHAGSATSINIDGVVPVGCSSRMGAAEGLEVARGSVVDLGAVSAQWRIVPFKFTNIDTESLVLQAHELPIHEFNQLILDYEDTYGVFLNQDDIDKSKMGVYGTIVQNIPSAYSSEWRDIANPNNQYVKRIDETCKDDIFYRYYIYAPLADYQKVYQRMEYRRPGIAVRNNISISQYSYIYQNAPKSGLSFYSAGSNGVAASSIKMTYNIIKLMV